MYVCLCQGLRESDVRELGACGITRPKELVQALGLAEPSCCGRCLRNVRRFVSLAELGARFGGDLLPISDAGCDRTEASMTAVGESIAS